MKDEPPKIAQTTANPSNSHFDSSDKHIDTNGISIGDNNGDRIKSEISIVQEIAQKRNLPIRFVVENESGPAHMKHFIIKCSVGDIEVSKF